MRAKLKKISPEQSDEYFATRPYTSRIGAWASEQSAVISSHKSLLAKAALIAAKHPLNVPRPPHWGGYLVIPDRIEFCKVAQAAYMTEFVIYTMRGNGKRAVIALSFLKTFKNNRTYKKCGRIRAVYRCLC